MFHFFENSVMLYHRHYNPATGLDEWHPTLFLQVDWHCRQKALHEAHGTKGQKKVLIRIPTGAPCGGKELVLPENYASPATQFCLQPGDWLAKMPAGTPAPAPGTALAQPPEPGGGTCCITAWRDNRSGFLPHLFVEGS